MLANNETGVLQPVAELAEAVHAKGALLHTDAVQAVGKIPVDVAELGVDLLSIASHKIHGPHGVGALYVRAGTRLVPQLYGGQQERGLRPGTENVTAIAGFGKACELAAARLTFESSRLARLRDELETLLLARLPDCRINGGKAPRLPNTSNVCFPGIHGETLAIRLDLLGVAVATGSACHSGEHGPSHVLQAMGLSYQEAASAIRFSLGPEHTSEEIAQVVERVCQAVSEMRGD
jgi:cysteine desulfurase